VQGEVTGKTAKEGKGAGDERVKVFSLWKETGRIKCKKKKKKKDKKKKSDKKKKKKNLCLVWFCFINPAGHRGRGKGCGINLPGGPHARGKNEEFGKFS